MNVQEMFDKAWDEVEVNESNTKAVLLLVALFPDKENIINSATSEEIIFDVNGDDLATLNQEQVNSIVATGVYYDEDYNALCVSI